MRYRLLLTPLFAFVLACTAPALAPSPTILPLRTLRLYETGVGYFERSGTLTPSTRTSLPVPSGHLDDALKTLVVLNAAGPSRVQGVEWESSLSQGMARALAGLKGDGTQPLRLQDLLGGLKGARLEVVADRKTTRGRLIDFSEADPAEAKGGEAKAGATTGLTTLLVLTEDGSLVRFDASHVESLRPLDAGYRARLGSALDALGSHVAESERLLHVASTGGPLALGYVAESPIWRTTYRLVLGGAAREAVLQGWALVHNDTDEDWTSVKISLVNGQPDSFLYPLAAPRYARRTLVTPDAALATVPQLMGTTVDALWGDNLGDASTEGASSVHGGAMGHGYGYGGGGGGIGLGTVGTIGHGAVEASSLLSGGNLASVATADVVPAGALFVYTLPDAVDLHGHASALFPFVAGTIDARPVTVFENASAKGRSGLRFVNSTSQTLPAGTLAVFEAGGFAGDTLLDRLLPTERRLLTYGADLDVELTEKAARVVEEPKRLVFVPASSDLQEHYFKTTDVTYGLENRSRTPRTVLLGTDLLRNATVTGSDQTELDAAGDHPELLFELPGAARVDRPCHFVEGLARTTHFASLTAAQLTTLGQTLSLPENDRAAALAAATQLREAEAAGAVSAQRKTESDELTKDIDRWRESMKALGDRGAANPFAARVLAGEDRRLTLRARQAASEKVKADHLARARLELGKLLR